MVRFTLQDLFEIALNMEKNGELFYRRVAEKCSRGDLRKLLHTLADMEVAHRELFSRMQKSVPAHLHELVFEIKDPGEYLYFQNLLQTKTMPMPRIDSLIEANPPEEDLIRYALDREKDSVIFYHTMKEFISPSEGAQQIDGIIREEVKHVQILSSVLQENSWNSPPRPPTP